MNIFVLIKAVPSVSGGLDGEQKTTELIINPADLCALEEALKFKASCGAKITVLTMGIQRCEQLLLTCIARGADEAVLITDPAFAGSDTCATSRILAKAIELSGDFDMIFCGRKSTDGETGQVGPGLAVRLHIPYVVNCTNLHLEDKTLQCSCLTDTGSEEVVLNTPALITFRNGINSPRLPSLIGLRKANQAQVRILDFNRIGLPCELTGQAGSPTIVIRSIKKDFQQRKPVMLDISRLDSAIDRIRSYIREETL